MQVFPVNTVRAAEVQEGVLGNVYLVVPRDARGSSVDALQAVPKKAGCRVSALVLTSSF